MYARYQLKQDAVAEAVMIGDCKAFRAASVVVRPTCDRSNVLMSMFALPEHRLVADCCVVPSCALISITKFCSNVRMLGGQRIVLTHSLACAEGAGRARGSG